MIFHLINKSASGRLKMKIIYTEKEKTIQKLSSEIAKYAYSIKSGQHYNIHYSPFHLELAKYLYKKCFRKLTKQPRSKR